MLNALSMTREIHFILALLSREGIIRMITTVLNSSSLVYIIHIHFLADTGSIKLSKYCQQRLTLAFAPLMALYKLPRIDISKCLIAMYVRNILSDNLKANSALQLVQ